MRSVAVIGKNFGDEGKGLVTAEICRKAEKPLIIKHNGGAQAGHTVESFDGKMRFVHHQIGSGAEYGVPTFLAETFHPDLFQLGNELREFFSSFGFYPVIYADPNAEITIIDDVILNMALETQRGNNRHGSCGMGINACCERNTAGFRISLSDVFERDYGSFLERLVLIRKEYFHQQLNELSISESNPYYPLFENNNVLENFIDEVYSAINYINLIDLNSENLKEYDEVVFETGQGLLLDMDNSTFFPHVTASKTGVDSSLSFLEKRGMRLDEAVYVSRPYVTRHGAGNLPYECSRESLSGVEIDKTNITNQWQGSIRYAKHGSLKEFIEPVIDDIKNADIKPSLVLTHLDETRGKVFFEDKVRSADELIQSIGCYFSSIYGSFDRQHIRLLH